MNRRLLLVLATVLVAVTGYQFGSFGTAVAHQPGLQEYAVDTGPAQWLASDTGGSTAWFRSTVALPAGATSATLWLDADQVYTFWVNGRRGPTNRDEVKAGVRPTLHALDITANLKIGDNTIAVQVANTDARPAAMLARVVVLQPDGTTIRQDSGTGSWRATSDASLLGGVPGRPAAFTDRTYSDKGWPVPQQRAPVRPSRSVLPQAVMEQPLTAQVLAAGDDLTLSTSVDLPTRPTGGWLRVAVQGAFEVTANGSLLYQRDEEPALQRGRPRPSTLWLLDIGRLLHAGSNTLVVHAHGSRQAAVYADGEIATPTGPVRTATGPAWRVSEQAGGAAATSVLLTDTWPLGLVRQAAATPDNTPRGFATDRPRTASLVFLAGLVLMAALVLLARHGRSLRSLAALRAADTSGTMLMLACGVLPAAAGLFLARVLARYVSFAGAFPYTSGVWTALLALLLLGVTAGAWSAVRDRTTVAGSAASTSAAIPSAASTSVLAPASTRTGGLFTSVRRRPTIASLVVFLMAVASTAIAGIGMGRQPLWQDEVVSIVAADGIRAHGLPRLPSGLYYFKGELYHGLLAVLRTMTESTTVMRSLSLFWFAATILAFGLLLIPTLAPRRPVVQVVATLLFATAPMELVWAHDIRMYQQMQFFSVVFVALFLRALTEGRRRQVIGSAAALLAMYLSHEESFVLLPVLPVLLLVRWRTGWWRDRTWIVSFGLVGAVVAAQYLLAQIHPPDFGSDLSNRTYVGYDPDQAWFYYTNVFFRTAATGGTLALVSSLALLAGVVGAVRRDLARGLAGLALLVALASVSLLFTVKIERYTFILLPLLFALATLGGADLLAALRRQLEGRQLRWTAVRPWSLNGPVVPRGMFLVVAVFAVLGVSASLAGAPRDFGTAVAQAAGGVSGTSRVDYQPVSEYVAAHWRPGDVYITLCPPNMPAHYLGRSPDRIVQTGRNKLLYAIERQGQATDTIFGSPLLLTGADVQGYIQQHRRVWLVTDTGSYAGGVPRDVKAALTASFRLQAQTAGAAAYLWTG